MSGGGERQRLFLSTSIPQRFHPAAIAVVVVAVVVVAADRMPDRIVRT